MKHHHFSQDQHQQSATPSPTNATRSLSAGLPSHEDVALRAYYSYVNNGSTDGQCEMNWLAAESELVAEHETARAQGL